MEHEAKIINNDYHTPNMGGYGMGGGGLAGIIVGALLGGGFLNNRNNQADITATIQSAINNAQTSNSIGQLGLQTANQTGDLQQSMNYNSQIAGVNQNVNEGFAGLRAENLTNSINSGFASVNSALCSGFAGVNANINMVNNSVLMESCKTQQAILNQTNTITSKMDSNTIALLQAELAESKAKNNSNEIIVNVGNTVTGSILTALKAMGTVK